MVSRSAEAGLLFAIRGYQLLLSPLFAGSCRFAPSCSEYARQAVREHGPVKGGCLALGRLARCHPLGRWGYDPVPSRGAGNE